MGDWNFERYYIRPAGIIDEPFSKLLEKIKGCDISYLIIINHVFCT
jgi:hypothetical protein